MRGLRLMNQFIKDHAVGSLLAALMLLCLSVFGYTFQETISLRARVWDLEQQSAGQQAEQDALKESLEQRTDQIGKQIESLSKSMDNRLLDIRDMVKTLINVLSDSDMPSGTAHAGG